PALDALAAAATEVEVQGEVQRELTRSDGNEQQSSASVSFALQVHPSARFSTTTSSKASSESQSKLSESGIARYRVHFGSVSKALAGIVAVVKPSRVIFILDEWSAIPLDLQPYLADLIRRAVFPVPGITVKIAAIEQRSNFKIGNSADYTGIEMGA